MKEEHAEIDGLSVFTAPLPARRAGKLKVRILGILAPMGDVAGNAVISEIAGAGLDGAEIRDLGKTVERVLRGVSGDLLDSLLCEILACSHVELDGKRVWLGDGKGIDQVFTGRLMTMYRVAGHALVVNFRDFFDAASTWWAKAKAKGEDAAAAKMTAIKEHQVKA